MKPKKPAPLDTDRIIDNYGEQLLEAMQSAEAVCAWLYAVAHRTCIAGPSCFRPALEGTSFCELHKCTTEGCGNQRERMFGKCEVCP